MIKNLLKSVVGLFPGSVQSGIRDRYWRAKSRLLYQTLYKWLELENTLPSGLTLRVASKGEWWTYNDIFVNGEYDIPILRALEKTVPLHPLTVVDLGANVGYFTLRIVDLLRQKRSECRVEVVMVEGSAKVHQDLESRMQSQKLPEVAFRVVHGLVGSRTGSAALQESAVHVKNTIMGSGNGNAGRVPFIDLNQLLTPDQSIDLLKCDIEGAELLFLENYEDLLCKTQVAVFELHHDMCDTQRCREILLGRGFQETVLRETPTFSVNLFTRQ